MTPLGGNLKITRIDPIALLQREHRVIQERLRAIESLINPTRAGLGELTECQRRMLHELFRFFTGSVRVHFRREAVLISVLERTSMYGPQERGPFDWLVREHHALEADGLRIAKRLNRRTFRASGVTLCRQHKKSGTFRLDLQAFVRRYREHMAWEERILFVLARMRLTVEQKQGTSQRMLEL